ncbi:hypothetical protein D3C75_621320 [compost metagenome]
MQAQEAGRKLSGESGNQDRTEETDGQPEAKKGFKAKAKKIMEDLDINVLDIVAFAGQAAWGLVQDRKNGNAQGSQVAAVPPVIAAGALGQQAAGQQPGGGGGFGSKLADSLGSLDLGGIFDKVKSLGEKAIAGSASDKDKQQWEAIQGNAGEAVNAMGQKAIEALRPALDMLSNAFTSEPVIGAVNLMANVFMVIATVISMVVEGLMYMATVIQQNWEIVGPILAAIAFVLLAAMIVQIYSMAVAWLVGMWPILLVVAAIALLIYYLKQSGVSMAEAAAFIGGAFGWLKVFIQNIGIFLYNIFISLADFFRNLFTDPVYAVQKLFYDLAMNILNFIYQMALGAESFAGGFIKVIAEAINFVLKKFKALTDFISKIPGFEFLANLQPRMLDTENPHVFSDLILSAKNLIKEPTSDKDVHNTTKKEFINPESEISKYSGKAVEMAGKFDSKVTIDEFKPDNPAAAAAQNIQNSAVSPAAEVNRVNEVGSIDDTVDISSEDLKMMRELAEIQAIQNFVELTPTVQVTTGNINNAGDIDTIITKIGQKLNEEFVSTAQGVYT